MKRRAFERFYHDNVRRIYRYVFFRVGQDHELAEDLVSEIFMKALRNFEKYDPKVSKSAWIYRIAQNHLANHYRDRKESVDLEEIAFYAVDVGSAKAHRQLMAGYDLGKALQVLSPEERRIVTMKHVDGYTYKEMAEILEKSQDSLKMAVSRAMGKLKKAES